MNTTVSNTLAATWAGTDNGDAIKHHCQKIFLGKFESLYICQAINNKLRVGEKTTTEEERSKFRKIPKDYVTPKTASKLTEVEFRQRFQKWTAVIDTRTEAEGHGQEPTDRTWNEEEFGRALDSMRELIYAMGRAAINTHLAIQFNEKYPNFTFSHGRKINTVEDFCDFIHYYQETTEFPLAKARAMTHFALYGMWGKSNHWAIKAEVEMMDILEIEYDGNRMSNNTFQKRKQRGGFVKTLLVKKLDMERNKVAKSWERCRDEKLISRDVYKPLPPPKENDDSGIQKRQKPDKSHLRKYIVFCKCDTDGFDGSYLLTENNKRRKEIDGLVQLKTKEEEEAEKKEKMIQAITDTLRKRDFASVVSELQGSGSASSILQLLQGSKVPDDIDVCREPSSKRQKVSTGSVDGNVSTVTHDGSFDGGSLASSLTEEEAAKSLEDSPLRGINVNEPLPMLEAAEKTVVARSAPRGKTLRLRPQGSIGKKVPRHPIPDAVNGEAPSPAAPAAPAPATPSSKKTQADSHPEKASSPRLGHKWNLPALPADFCCENANHNSPGVFSLYEAYFFTKIERTSKPYLPKSCLRCRKVFVTYQKKKKELNLAEDYYLRTAGTGVRACAGCFEPRDDDQTKATCNRSFCAACWPTVEPEPNVAAV